MTMLAVTHLTPVVGIDVHEVIIPPSTAPIPIPHPHVGFVLDLQEYISAATAAIGSIAFSFAEEQASSFLEAHQADVEKIANSHIVQSATGAIDKVMESSAVQAGTSAMHSAAQFGKDMTVALGGNVGRGGGGRPILVNGLMRATAGTHTNHVPGLHFPLGAAFAGADARGPSQDSESFMGSRTVLANNDPMSFLALPALSCWCAGMEPMKHNSAHTDRTYPSLPTSTMLPIPAGNPVLVGGPPIMNMMAAAAALFKAFRGSALAKRIFRNFPSGYIKCVVFDAEPVNSITGEVVVQQRDFTVEGRLPLTWDRYYASHDPFVGALGRGWQCPADIRVEFLRDGEQFGAAVYFPDHATAFDGFPGRPGWSERCYDRQHGHALYIQDDKAVIRTRLGIEYDFLLPEAGLEQVPEVGSGDRPLSAGVSRISDLNGNAWRVERDARLHVSGPALRFVEEAGHASTGRVVECFRGDVGGCIGRVVLQHGQGGTHPLVRYRQSEVGTLTSVDDALGKAYGFGYGDAYQMVRHTDRNGLSFYYTHALHDDGVWRVERAWGDGGLYDYAFTYDPEHLETRFTDSLGHATVLQYNDRQWPVARIDGTGAVRSYQYDGRGRTSAEIDPAGNVTRWEYDRYGNLVSHTLPDRSVVRTRYDDHHRPILVTDPEGGAWQQTWDERGNLLKQVTPSGSETSFGYDVRGQLVQVRDAARQITTLSYDRFGYLASLIDALGRTTHFAHDMRGNLIRHEAPGEKPATYVWDAKDRLIACGLPGGGDVRCEYDAEDNLLRYHDEAGHTTAFSYYGQGQLASRTDPDGSVTRYHYDTEERLTGVTNPVGQTWHLKRDAAGRLVEEVDYYGKSRRYAYDPAGHLARTVDPLGQVLRVTCDAMGRITCRRVDTSGADGGAYRCGDEEYYAYNRRGQLTEARNAHSSVARKYDAEGRLTGETQLQPGFSGVVDYVYDGSGRLERQTRRFGEMPDGTCFSQTLTYGYDVLGEIETLQVDGHTPVRFTRDVAGRIAHVGLGAGLEHRYAYDDAGRLIRQATVRGGREDGHTAYQYDAVGNLVVRHDSGMGEDRYRHDPLGRIVAHVDPAGRLQRFVHDAHGDRFRSYANGDGRVLRHDDGALWQLDAAGQLVGRQSPSIGVQRLEWDGFGRLTCFENTRNECWRYSYDALGRRIGKTAAEVRRHAGSVKHAQQGAQTWFVWDGDVFAAELIRPAGGDSGRTARLYVYHAGSFEPLAMQVQRWTDSADAALADAQLYHYQNDPNGAPVRLRDRDGQVVWEAHYGVTGGLDHVEVREVDQPLRLQGQYHDAESNLHYNRYRYYDPNTGIFISQDPIGLEGGLNPYEYAPNTLLWVDPLGLVNWANHGNKHVATPSKKVPWSHIVKSTQNGPAKYLPGTNIEALERMVHAEGQAVTNGKPWKVMDMGKVIGASEGRETSFVRVEESAGTIHGHPISKEEFKKLTCIQIRKK
jgi:RHS repeat-associated protein